VKSWFDSLSERERWMVIAVAAALVIFLFYLIVVQPLLSANRELHEAVETGHRDYAWMTSRAVEAKSLLLAGPSGQREDDRTLIARVTSELRTKDINPKQVRPEGESRLNLTFEEVVFVDLMERLEYLHTAYDIRVAKASLEPGGGPGLVNVRLTLTR
jgi:general secretion pathway protein M